MKIYEFLLVAYPRCVGPSIVPCERQKNASIFFFDFVMAVLLNVNYYSSFSLAGF